jgi:hypothetical protein
MTVTRKIALAVTVFVLCAAAVMQINAGYAGDKDWLLLAAREWLGGRELDVEVIEVNPPLIVWLYAIPVWVSLHYGFLKDYMVLALMGLLLSGLSVYTCLRLIRLHPAFDGNAQRQFDFALMLALLFIFFTSPVYFCDRDHLFWILIFPYLLRFMPGLARVRITSPITLGISLLAALGFCIKPHTLIVFAILQALVMRRERSMNILMSIENRIIYAAALLYFACVLLFVPEYIHVIMPMAFATYSAFSRRLMGIFYCIFASVLAGVCFADFRLRYTSPYRADVFYFIGTNVAFLFYALAGNGWGYTYHPLLGTLLFITYWLYLEYGWLARDYREQEAAARQFKFGMRACTLSLFCNACYMLYNMAVFFSEPARDWSAEFIKNQPYVEYIEAHHIPSFGAFSEDFHKWPSLARLTGAAFETRYNALWMVPELAQERKKYGEIPASHQWIMQNVGRGLADDLTRRKPSIVFTDSSPQFFGYDFAIDLPEFFSGVAEFKKAWSHYRYLLTIDRCKAENHSDNRSYSGCRYAIYGRVP